jgi:hypothetical protein
VEVAKNSEIQAQLLEREVILVFYFYLFGAGETNSSLYTMTFFLRLLTCIKERNLEVLAGL